MGLDPYYIFTTVIPSLIWDPVDPFGFRNPLVLTLVLTVIPAILGNLLAIPVAVARLSRNLLLSAPSYCFIMLMRGTPLLVQIYFVYYGLGELFPGSWVQRSFLWPYLRDSFWYAVIALTINTAGYTGEILRGAIRNVPYGEIEAGKAFGMSRWKIFWRITLPRAIRICLPAMSGETILLLKATSLVSVIAMYELMGETRRLFSVSFRIYDTLIGAAIVYIVLVYGLTRLLYWVEGRLNKDRLAPASSPSRDPLNIPVG
jgi:octopine/nopaline transport system permease protein